MLKRLTIFLSLSFLTGCITINMRPELSRFPPSPKQIEYTKDPIIEYNENGTYLVTEEMVEKSTLQHLYLNAILDWKKENNIK
jgi:hypothetical protein